MVTKINKRMRIFFTLAVLFVINWTGFGQQAKLLCSLNDAIIETSGLIYVNNTLITHNDSGDVPALYEIDTTNGEIKRKVIIRNAGHIDWEDISNDDHFIYVGDFGNNFGSRKDLCIYKVSIEDYFAAQNDSIDAELISFSYKDQKSFKHNPSYTNYDAEAVMSYNDSLYIFTKNWGDNLSYIYSCPKEPGTYTLSIVDCINPKGLVTGATYNPDNHAILLSGYVFFFPILTEIKNFTGNNFSDGQIRRLMLAKKGSTQIEGISVINQDTYFFSSEANRLGKASLYSLSDKDLEEMKIRERQIGSSLLIKFMSRIKSNAIFTILFKFAMKMYFR